MPYLFLATFLWSTSFIVGKLAYGFADAMMIVLFRQIIAALCVLPFFIRVYRSVPKHLWAKLIMLSLMSYPVTFTLQFLGLKYTSASSAMAVLGLEPVLIVLIGIFFFKEKRNTIMILLGLCAFLGVVFMVWSPNDTEIRWQGCLLILLSTIQTAFWLRISQNVLRQISPRIYTSLPSAWHQY